MNSSQSEYGKLVKVLVNHAENAFYSEELIAEQWQKLNYSDKPNLEAAKREYSYFVGLLQAGGAEVEYLNARDLDSIYVRDASIITDKGVIICNMGKGDRAAEPLKQKEFYKKLGYDILGDIRGNGKLEGGDVAWLDKETLAVGRGYRTNTAGISQLRRLLSGFAEVLEVQLPHYKGPLDVFHLMSILSPVDKDLAVVYSPLMPVSFREELLVRGFELVEVPDEEFESKGCNVLAIAPRKCIVVEGNPKTRQRLEAVNVMVYEYKGDEITQKGDGGPTCLTRPLIRESN